MLYTFITETIFWQMMQASLPSLSIEVFASRIFFEIPAFVTNFPSLWCHTVVKFNHNCVSLVSAVQVIHHFTVSYYYFQQRRTLIHLLSDSAPVFRGPWNILDLHGTIGSYLWQIKAGCLCLLLHSTAPPTFPYSTHAFNIT